VTERPRARADTPAVDPDPDRSVGGPVRGRPTKAQDAPRGPDQVRAAAVAAATELFARRGLASVSVREVAAAAGVNPSLVHRYVGGKDELLRAVLAGLLDRLRTDVAAFDRQATGEPLPGDMAYALATHQRIVAHLVIEGYALADYQADFPVMDHIVAEIQEAYGIDDATARVQATVIYAHDLAMRLFLPLLLRAAGLQPTDADDLRRSAQIVNLRLSQPL